MGMLCPIVQALARAMFNTWHDLALCGVLGPEPIGNHHPRRAPWLFDSLRIWRLDAFAFRRLFTRTSSTKPS